MTTQGRCGFTSWNTKVKCFNIFWISKQWWRRRTVWAWMPKVRWRGIVFLKWIQWILEGAWNSKEVLMYLFPAAKWSCWKEKQAHSRNSMCHAEWEEFAKLLLGWSSSNCSVYHELNTHSNSSWHDTWRKIHRQETKCFTPQNVWLHCICACSWWEEIKTRSKSWEVHLHWIFLRTKMI